MKWKEKTLKNEIKLGHMQKNPKALKALQVILVSVIIVSFVNYCEF